MSDAFDIYFSHLFDDFTVSLWTRIVVFIAASVILGLRKGWRKGIGLLLLGYFIVILYVTVFSRPSDDEQKYSLRPFTSYVTIADGDWYMLPQIIMNVVMFVPVGVLLTVVKREWGWKKIFLCGILLSLTIEFLQYVMLKGTLETDDLIHNMLGCAIGWGMAKMLFTIQKYHEKDIFDKK